MLLTDVVEKYAAEKNQGLAPDQPPHTVVLPFGLHDKVSITLTVYDHFMIPLTATHMRM